MGMSGAASKPSAGDTSRVTAMQEDGAQRQAAGLVSSYGTGRSRQAPVSHPRTSPGFSVSRCRSPESKSTLNMSKHWGSRLLSATMTCTPQEACMSVLQDPSTGQRGSQGAHGA